MKLEEVLPALRAGKKIKRKEWINPNTNCYMYDLSDIDLLAEDWEIVEESKCELCGGTGKMKVIPYFPESELYQDGVFNPNKMYEFKYIDCPECKCL